MYKIIGADQKEYGPVSSDQIRLWIQEGRLNANSSVQAEGTIGWKPLREVAEFAAVLPPPPPPAAPPPITFRPGAGPVPASPYVVPTSGKTNPLAMWSFGTGLFTLLCCQFLSPVSIVLGAMALSEIRKNPNQGGHGFAVAGIILGSISLLFALIAVTVGIMVPGAFGNLFGNHMFPR